MISKQLLSFVVAISLALIGCGKSKSETKVELIISAASSLTDAMNEVKELYQEQQPEVEIIYNFGSSGSLQQQIEQGAPVDVFFSAATKQMDALQKNQLLLSDTRRNLLQNQVVLVTSSDANSIEDFTDLTQANQISIGEPGSVPAGKYAREILTSLKLYDRLESKTVMARNVRQVLSYVETGNVDAGIVYATDAQQSKRVQTVAVAPETSHAPAVYPVAVVKDSQNSSAANEFIQFLASDRAGEVFERYGFARIPPHVATQ